MREINLWKAIYMCTLFATITYSINSHKHIATFMTAPMLANQIHALVYNYYTLHQ